MFVCVSVRERVNFNLQTIQRGANYPGGLRLTRQLKREHIFISLDVVGSGRDHGTIPGGRKGEQTAERPGKAASRADFYTRNV